MTTVDADTTTQASAANTTAVPEAAAVTPSRKQRLLIIEPLLNGHHANYLQNVALGALAHGFFVTVATSADNRDKPQLSWADGLENLTIDFNDHLQRVDPGRSGPLGLIKRDAAYYQAFKHVYEMHRADGIDLVLLPYADYCIYPIGLIGSPFGQTPWRGIVMRQTFHHRAMGIKSPTDKLGQVKKWLLRRALRNRHLSRLMTIDPSLQEFAKNHWNQESKKLVYMPDPAEQVTIVERDIARQALGIKRDCCVILVYGALSMRKGVQHLLPLLSTSTCDNHFHLLLVGSTDGGFNSLINSDQYRSLKAQNRVTLINRRADAELQDHAFSASDICWLGYDGHYGMSGVLILSERYGVPSLVSDEGLLGWLNSKYHFGLTASSINHESFHLTNLLSEKTNFFRKDNTQARINFIGNHNWKNSQAIIWDNNELNPHDHHM